MSGEYLFFSQTSIVRILFNDLFQKITPGATLFPQLEFDATAFDESLAPREMEFLSLSPIEILTSDQCQQVGAYLSVCFALGLTDCHQGNLLLGMKGQDFTFVSVDCETLLTKSDPEASCFFQLKSNCPCPGPFCTSFGLGILEKQNHHNEQQFLAAGVLSGFRQMIKLIITHHATLTEVLSEFLKDHRLVRRVLLNNTYTYAQALATGDFTQFRLEEKEQLQRGEIPYFFKNHGGDEIYYWESLTHKRPLRPRLPVSEMPGIESQERLQALTETATALILRSLDFWPNATYSSSYKDLSIVYKPDSILYPSSSGDLVTIRRHGS